MKESTLTTIAALQMPMQPQREANLDTVSRLVREAAANGAQVILPPELFGGWYFCQHERAESFGQAESLADSAVVATMRSLARECGVVIPTSFFERSGQVCYNSMAMVNCAGDIEGVYRKSHIPDGPGYEEKFYFRPGNSGFKVWPTPFGTLGVGICWDQWFPEAARIMALRGADFLLYPTAIGSEPNEPGLDTRNMWRRVMQGHAVANQTPVIAANRTGQEDAITFYGTSFICDCAGDIVADAGASPEAILYAQFDRRAIREARDGMGFFRDRRPDLYGDLCQQL